MKSLTIYDPIFPAIGKVFGDSRRIDPFDLLDRVFDADLFGAGTRSPAIDVREEDGRYVIEAELPGLSEKDVKLELKDGLLSLSTAQSTENVEENKAMKWLRRERREFSFNRSFAIPENADGEKIEARFKNGLLTVELPKKPEASPRLVPVRAA
jgi:HSP20 family protein